MNEKMLPCPFCGGEAKVIEDSILICGHRYWRIIHNSNNCPITDAFGIFRSSAKYSTAEKAIAAWNRRAQPGNEPIVRCGECIHFELYDGEEHKGNCNELVGLDSCMYEDDYCS